MKFVPVHVCAIIMTFMFNMKECKVAQVVGPAALRGVEPAYADDEVDDIGLLLAVLLVAARNRPCGCCCCCCGCGNNVHLPVPYPIPIPTYNPIINLKTLDERPRDGGLGGNRATAAATATGGSSVASGKASSQATQIINIHTGDCDCDVESDDFEHEPHI